MPPGISTLSLKPGNSASGVKNYKEFLKKIGGANCAQGVKCIVFFS